MLDPERVASHLEKGVIEVAPLAFMRGRTLNDSFVILDEAQNTTPEQMKMFLTRLGFGSSMVVTGDITQVDLPRDQKSGLIVVGDILEGIEGVEFVRFGGEDVVRHKLVQRIVEAYDRHSAEQPSDLRTANGPPAANRVIASADDPPMLEIDVIGSAPPAVRVEEAVACAAAVGGDRGGPRRDRFRVAERIAELNETWRGRPGPTDVLSFPVDEDEQTYGERELGDVLSAPSTPRTSWRRSCTACCT